MTTRLGSHIARYDEQGLLQPWTDFPDTIEREMAWYLACPFEQGYPRFVCTTFMEGDYSASPERDDFIPATQNSMGILSYLKYFQFRGRTQPRILALAQAMGDFLLDQALTPDQGAYPRFPRSTGRRGHFPLPADCGAQGDRPFEIQPDKGGMVGYALVRLHEATAIRRYLEAALHIARVLVANMGRGEDLRSPWPFRADFRTAAGRGEISGNMVYILRLFDRLLEAGWSEFAEPRASLWTWIKVYQIPSAAGDGRLWEQFFEDHDEADNRTAWAPLNLARYLLEERDRLEAEWLADAEILIGFVERHFTSRQAGVLVCGEQDHDHQPWGGILSTWGAVLALRAAATGSDHYRLLAHQALSLALYAVDEDGAPRDLVFSDRRGGWQEDAHTDKVHNILDALAAIPEWRG